MFYLSSIDFFTYEVNQQRFFVPETLSYGAQVFKSLEIKLRVILNLIIHTLMWFVDSDSELHSLVVLFILIWCFLFLKNLQINIINL